jgi:hypothetical protein
VIGKITGFSGGMSGIARVVFEDGSTALVESGFGLRQFVEAFGSLQAAIGQEIEYDVDDLGIMMRFGPVPNMRGAL